MNASATVGVGSCLSTSKPLSIGLSPVPIYLRRRKRRCLTIEAEVQLAGSEVQSTYRRLIILRHAKSSWQHPALRDHDRPLSKSGRVDAIAVSQKLQRMGWIPQLILSSDAVRTRETLKIMQEQVRGFLEAEVHFISSFYSIAAMDGQTAEHLQRTICQYSTDEILTIIGWEEAASMFTGASVELKTCNAALLEAPGKSWEEAFAVAGYGGWKLQGIVTPSSNLYRHSENFEQI
ncbi:protease Do-like 10 [Hibiscus syriacus]|uniref:Protease Do-like 10 n=1 Tax=Hibiscus syriacus TaxID=106335 RepID=A0A6A3D412_HIBSY|nr:protease Do-like 10 [Hibiscus syriacus]